MKYIVITSIHGMTDAMKKVVDLGWNVIVVGDKKSKPIESTDQVTYLSVEDQQKLGYRLVDELPYNHYTRKNIGYLHAMKLGATFIYETDDDNHPSENWKEPSLVSRNRLSSRGKFLNVFQHYSDQRPVWPRGYPLDEVLQDDLYLVEDTDEWLVPVWQGLTTGDSDVDSIYRLTNGELIEFDGDPVYLKQGSYCPFNSQTTFWFKDAFPLMYLPTTVEFRFTDILRSYIAQPILWASNLHLGFIGENTLTERNVHDLMSDFRDEVRMFSRLKDIVGYIEDAIDDCIMHNNLRSVYKSLYDNGIVEKQELITLDTWLEGME